MEAVGNTVQQAVELVDNQWKGAEVAGDIVSTCVIVHCVVVVMHIPSGTANVGAGAGMFVWRPCSYLHPWRECGYISGYQHCHLGAHPCSCLPVASRHNQFQRQAG